MIDYLKALSDGFNAKITPERGVGCGRIYVVISADFRLDKETYKKEIKLHSDGISKAAEKLGKIYQKKAHYGLRNALYIGYDNCDGNALARGTAVVAALKMAGIVSYREECGD